MPLDTLFNYHFVDQAVPFIRSVPIEIDLPEVGTLKINSRVGPSFGGKLSAEFAKFRSYLPRIQKPKPGVVMISHLLIPGDDNPLALRFALSSLITHLKPDLEKNELYSWAHFAERKVLSTNTAYYRKLEDLIKDAEESMPLIAKENLDLLAKIQLEKLQNYTERINNNF